MTTINAIRLDFYSGLLLSDEERTWHLKQRLYSLEKMKNILPPSFQEEQEVYLRMGTTGTCSVSVEMGRMAKIKINQLYEEEKEKRGEIPENFFTIEDISRIVFSSMVELKHKHIDQLLRATYGFGTKDFIRGYYKSGDKKIEIKDKAVLKDAGDIITWTKKNPNTNKIMGNMAIIAGYEPKDGFRIFHLSLARHSCEPVPFVFQIDGSGGDIAEVPYSDYINNKTLSYRKGDIEPVEAMVTMLEGFIRAKRMCIGVGGWPNITYINGREKDRKRKVRVIDDDRAKLASEIVDAWQKELLSKQTCYKLVEDLVFKEKDFEKVQSEMWKKASNERLLSRYLRGHKV